MRGAPSLPPPAEGAPIFRVERRSHKSGTGAAGDPLIEEVTFVAPMRVLLWKKWARTRVRQAIDMGGGGRSVILRFDLLGSVSEGGRVWMQEGVARAAGRVEAKQQS